MNNSNRGSIWRKWDLHVHTPASIYQCFGNNDDQTWENFINDLELLPEQFNVIGINDYFFLDGLARLKKAKDEQGRIPNLTLIPVVEFRIEKFAGVQFGPLKRINMHVIFSETLSLETIQSQFLNTLEQSYSLEKGGQWTRAITHDSVEELGRQIKSQVPADELSKYGSDIIEGFNNLNVSETAIFNALKKDCFKDKYLIAIGKTEWGDLKWTNASIALKKSIINSAQIVFTAAESVDAFIKAKKQLNSQLVNDLLLDCSDAHYLSNSTDKDRIGNCNTWIKAHPTFEGLRQILFEPDQRLKIQISEPDFKEEKLVIDEIRFISSDETFPPHPIKLNKNLNVIIGGKSSGKSILLYNIARTLLTDRSNNGPLKFRDTEDNTFKYLYEFNDDASIFDFVITLKSGSQQSIHRADNEPSILADLKYIPQNHLSNLVDRSRRQGNTLKKLIRGLILEEESCNSAYGNFLDRVKLNDAQRNRLIDDYFQVKEKVTKQEQEVMLKGDQTALIASITKNQLQIKTLNKESGLSAEQIAEYDKYNVELNELNIARTKIINDYRKLSTFHEELKVAMLSLDQKKSQILESLETDEITQEFNLKYNFTSTAVNSLLEIEKLYQVSDQKELINDSSIKSALAANAQRKQLLENLLKPLRLNQESKLQIATLEKSIQEDQQKLSAIQQLQAEIVANKNNLTQRQEAVYKAFFENFKEYENIINALEPRIKSIEGEDDKLEIKGLVKFNFPKFKSLIEEITDLRSFDIRQLALFKSPKTALSNFTFEEILDQLKSLFSQIIDDTHPLKRTTKVEACKKVFTDFFFDHWEVTSEDDTIHNMSTGKASFVLLKLIIKLSNAKAPILIDQPEDNLDNRSVTKDLVTYLRDKKLERQIIIVTHNPNIVVNADAENIIVANQKGQNNIESSSPYKFDYINGALEDSFPKNGDETDILKSMGIRQHIAEIVEGGEDAFKNRELKYCF